MFGVEDVALRAAAGAPGLVVFRKHVVSGAEIIKGGRGIVGLLAQIAHNSWQPGFRSDSESARLEPPRRRI